MDWRAGHLTTTEGKEIGAFANKNCPQGRAFEKIFKCPGMPGGLPGEMLAVGIDSHINYKCKTSWSNAFRYRYTVSEVTHAPRKQVTTVNNTALTSSWDFSLPWYFPSHINPISRFLRQLKT